MPIKAVLFDLDDTLAPETSLTRTALTQAADAVRVQHLSPGGLAATAAASPPAKTGAIAYSSPPVSAGTIIAADSQ